MTLAVILLSCNQLKLTYDVVSDIKQQDEGLDLYVVDNGGGYERQHNEYIIKPPENMRWVRGVNMAIKFAYSWRDYEAVVCLNDDIRLSPGFFDGLWEAMRANPDAGLIAPMYDDVYPEQKGDYQGPAQGYVGLDREDSVKVVDGTAFLIPSNVLECVGLLDEERFGKYGWGSDIDYAYRVREFGDKVLVTHRAYINHFHQGSAKYVERDWSGKAGMEMEAGMNDKYGPEWRSIVYGEGSIF